MKKREPFTRGDLILKFWKLKMLVSNIAKLIDHCDDSSTHLELMLTISNIRVMIYERDK